MSHIDLITLEGALEAYIAGLNRPRENPVTMRRLVSHFFKHSYDEIVEALEGLLAHNRVRQVATTPSAHRKWNGAYGYEHADAVAYHVAKQHNKAINRYWE